MTANISKCRAQPSNDNVVLVEEDRVGTLGMQPWPQLPEYRHPPVTETVLAVKFRAIQDFDAVKIVEFWTEHLRDSNDPRLPVSQIRLPYDMPIERFNQGPDQVPGNLLQFVNYGQGTVPARFWFSSEDEESLVQIQHDWIAFNWRKQASFPYKRYGHGRKAFEDLWNALQAFLDDREMGKLTPVQCEITYINNIATAPGVWGDHGDAVSVTHLIDRPHEGLLPKQESINLSTQYVAKDSNSIPFARLHVQFNSAYSVPESQPVFGMNLTFRGRPLSEDIEGVKGFFDAGHNWIVGSFDELTTNKMHDVWVREMREEGS